eukprot:6472134-Pyramimonas_sp.AAC.1
MSLDAPAWPAARTGKVLASPPAPCTPRSDSASPLLQKPCSMAWCGDLTAPGALPPHTPACPASSPGPLPPGTPR